MSHAEAWERIELSIPAVDGEPLSAVLHRPRVGETKGIVQLNSGVGIKKEFYQFFSQFLASEGFAVIGFDYRGIGGSRRASLRQCAARLSDWGTLDMVGVADWCGREFSEDRQFVVGHSVGGQLLGSMSNHHRWAAAVLVSAGTGYWRDFLPPERLRCAFAWFVYLPLATRLLGYSPMSHVGLGEDLPRAVGRQLAQWCTSPDYLQDHRGRSIEHGHWANVSCPLLSIYAADDRMTNAVTSRRLLAYYSSAEVTLREVSPDEAGRKIGHFGIFSRKSRDTWGEIAAFLQHGGSRSELGTAPQLTQRASLDRNIRT